MLVVTQAKHRFSSISKRAAYTDARTAPLVGEAQLIYRWEAQPDDVAPLIHAHPTQNEALGEAFLALAGKPLHTRG